MERYEESDGRYVLYVESVRTLETECVALLVDLVLGKLITHGDPRSVRCEYDALRRVTRPELTEGWLLLEGRPALAALNRALHGPLDVEALHLAFTRGAAKRIADALLARLKKGEWT